MTGGCTDCGTTNPEGARFCMGCGGALTRRCAACAAEAPPQARFCMGCGAGLDAEGSAAPQAPEALPEERRQVTVLFADLSGYTAVAERLDPETVKGLVDRSLRRLGAEVERFGGTVDKYIGDNVMALFGAPTAHEDDAERAIRAALAMLDAMEDVNALVPDGVSFKLRVGVNTGEVLAGAVGDEYTVTGDTVNVASRLQTAGRPGAITAGERTVRATRGAIHYRELAPLTLKGKADPVPAWEVERVDAPHAAGRSPGAQTPLVGRVEELATMEAAYRRVVLDEHPALVTLVGEAGVGKTRLLREFAGRVEVAKPPAVVRVGRCLHYGSGIVLWALGEVLRAEAEIVDSDSADVAWAKLLAYVVRAHPDREGDLSERRAARIARSLGIEVPPEWHDDEGDPVRARDAFLSALRSVIEGSARTSSLVLVFEDIHWADDSMLDAIEHLIGWVRAPLLVICLARDELLDRRPGWGAGRRHETMLFLDPLNAANSRELVAALLDERDGSPELLGLVAERSGGNPLFAEEMALRLLEEGPIDGDELPDTVQGVLAARIDSLEPFERRLVQQAAVVGRTFWEGSLTALAEAEGQDLNRALASLQRKDILAPGAESRLAGERELAFKHVLIRDVAYGMLPKAVRCRKHFEVGRFLEERAGDRSDEVVSLLAEHFGRAAALGREAAVDPQELHKITARAVCFLEEAGDVAAGLYVNREAVSHYKHAIGLLSSDDERAAARIGEKQGEVELRIGRVDAALGLWGECIEYHRGQEDLDRVADLHRKLGAALAVKGERKAAIENYQRGINLLKDGEPRIELVRLYEEAAWLYLQTGDNMLAIYASEKALRLAERLGETRAASRAHGIFGRVFGRIGDTEKARQNLQRSVELARGSDHAETILALLALGRHLEISEADSAAASAAYDEALALAEQVGDLPSQVELHAAVAQLACYRADWEGVERSTAAATRLAEREGLLSTLGLPYALRAFLLWRDGDLEASEREFKRARDVAEQVGWSELAFSALAGEALVLRDRGEHTAAVATLDRAIEVCERGALPQLIQATATRAVVLVLAGRIELARADARQAGELAERMPYAIGRAAALEAEGVTASEPAETRRLLGEAEAAFTALERPLEAARCRLTAGYLLKDPELLDGAAKECDRLGIAHLALRARSLAPSF